MHKIEQPTGSHVDGVLEKPDTIPDVIHMF